MGERQKADTSCATHLPQHPNGFLMNLTAVPISSMELILMRSQGRWLPPQKLRVGRMGVEV